MLEREDLEFGGYKAHFGSDNRKDLSEGKFVNRDSTETPLDKRIVSGISALVVGVGVAAGSMFPKKANADEGVINFKSLVTNKGSMPSQDLSGDSSNEVTPAPSNMEVVEPEPSPTPEYAVKEKETARYIEELKADGCQEINLDFCADLLYARENANGFQVGGKEFDYSKTILANYLATDKIFTFGRTGKGLDVIYFKDENGKKTKEPALLYLGVSDYNVGLKQVQDAIDQQEKSAPGFLRAMVDNDARVILQNKVNNQPGAIAKYGAGVIFFNCGLIDKKVSGSGNFVKRLKIIFEVEQFGTRGDALWDLSYAGIVAVIKESLAADCCSYLYQKTKDKFYKDQMEFHKENEVRYRTQVHSDSTKIDALILDIKKRGLMVPYGAKTWEEIDSVIAATETDLDLLAKK